MKSQSLLLSLLLSICVISQMVAQCTLFNNTPQNLLVPACNDIAFNNVIFSKAEAFILQIPNPEPNSTITVDICDSGYPVPANEMELVIVDPFENVIAQAFDCSIQFMPTVPGNYLFIFNVAGMCGILGSENGFGIVIAQDCDGCLADRLQMIEYVLDPLSDINYYPFLSTLWCPFIDFGFGPGFEGLVPAGTVIRPGNYVNDPGFITPFDAYFFYIDDDPNARFTHATRFILIDPTDCDPSLSSGSVLIFNELWWPELEPLFLPPFEPFPHESLSPQPPAPDNPLGLVDGIFTLENEIEIPIIDLSDLFVNKTAALVVAGDNRSDFRADIPVWKSQLQDTMKVDSARIICAANDSAVTAQQFCDLLDTLCALACKPDTVIIRISTHGGIDKLWFNNNTFLTEQQLCTKMQKVAKLGVPIMLLIDACNSSSLYDANNWGFPAGSMIIVAAKSGRTAKGATFLEADTSGMPIPGTRTTGGFMSYFLKKCMNDTTGIGSDGYSTADTDKSGRVDDCEAFNWVNSQNPCVFIPFGSGVTYLIGTYSISGHKYFPAGQPPGFMPDTIITLADGSQLAIKGNSIVSNWTPDPSYRAVGSFSNTMNWNVKNMTGADQTSFYMTFCGDVSNGIGSAWLSDSLDNTGVFWTEIFGATATYNPLFDETVVCWMGDEISNGEYIHFGWSIDEGKLRPKRQYWGNLVINNFSGASGAQQTASLVPTTQSSILTENGGANLTVQTVNLNAFQGGNDHPVDFTIGYRISPSEIPLDSLSQGNAMVQALSYHAVGIGTIEPDTFHTFQLIVPDDIRPGEVLILQVELDWTLNGSTNDQLIQFSALEPLVCTGDITFIDGTLMPKQVNSDGTVTLRNVSFQPGLNIINAKNGIECEPGVLVDLPLGVTVRVYDYGCGE